MVPRIRQVQIRNYKSFGEAVVDLAPLTVLVGPNGSGKSNFLDALSLVRDCLTQPIQQAWANHGGSAVAPRWSSGTAGRTGFRFLLDLAQGVSADYAFEISWGPLFRVVRERCAVQPPHGPVFEVADGRFVHEIPGIRPQIAADRLALFAASAAEEFRPVYDFLTSMQFYSIDPLRLASPAEAAPARSLEPDGSNAGAVLKLLQEQRPETYQRICRLLSRAVLGLREVHPLERDRQILLGFQQDIGAEAPGLFLGNEMSEGTLRILGLLLAAYQPQPPTLLAIEEPEATVHPAAAEILVQVLLDVARERQVLVTTHSPDILDAKELSDESIRLVSKLQGRTVIAALASASRQAIRDRLYTPGELLRSDELDQDVEAATAAAQRFDLFPAR